MYAKVKSLFMYVSGIKFLIPALDKRSKKTNLIKQDFIDVFVSGGGIQGNYISAPATITVFTK